MNLVLLLELVSKELNHLAAILQDYAGSFITFFMGKVNPILNNIYFWLRDHYLLLELVSKELNHLAAILHVYAGGLNFMK